MKNCVRSLSRRNLLQRLGALATGMGVWAGKPAIAHEHIDTDTAGGHPRALALIGDRYHNSDYIRVSLDRLFRELGLPIDYTTNYDRISRNLLRNYQLFICLRDGMIWPDGYLGPDAYSDYERFLEAGFDWERPTSSKETPKSWITEEQGEAIKDFVTAGNGFYALHNSSHISLSSTSYRDVMAYEHYGTQSISGWAYEYGKGRVVFTAVGHNNPAMWQPEYFKLQKNAVRWLLKMA